MTEISEEELRMRSEVLDLFEQINEITAGHSLNLVANALACVFATVIMEATDADQDLEKMIDECMGQMGECVRAVIHGDGPLVLRKKGAN